MNSLAVSSEVFAHLHKTSIIPPSQHPQHFTLFHLALLQDNIRRLLSDHVRRDRGESARNLRVDGSIDDTQARGAADPEARVKNRHLIVVGADRARGRSVVAPGGVLGVLGEGFLGGDVLAGENLVDVDGLAGEGVTGEVDGLLEGGEILLVVTGAGVEVVVGDVGNIEGVSGAELDSSCGVAGVGLEDCPGEPVVVGGGVDAVVGEVTTEVDRATENEEVEVVALGHARLVEHGGADTGGGVDATVAVDRRVPAVEALVLGTAVESAAIECDEVRGSLALDVDLVVILEVGANTGKVDDDGDVELLKLVGRTDTTELEELRRVVGTTGDNHFARSSCSSSDTSLAAAPGASLVEILAVKELDTSSTRRGGVIEVDLGNVAVGPDICCTN